MLRSIRNGRPNEWAIFEFKRGGGGVAAVSQLVRYLEEIAKEELGPLRGIVVASEELEVPLAQTPAAGCQWPIEWWTFTPVFKPTSTWAGSPN